MLSQLPSLGRALLTALLAHFICLNYFVLRSVKDALVVTAYERASILPTLKLWAMLPILLLTGLISTRLVRRLGHKGLTIAALLSFTLAFAAFALFELPLPLFYITCELWKVVALSIIFWGFASLRSNPREASWQYPLYLIAGSLSALVASWWVAHLLPYNWQRATLLSASGLSLLSLIVYLPLHREAGTRIELPPRLRGSLSAILSSRLLLWLGLLIVTEYVTLQLIEILWKEAIYRAFPDPTSYCAYCNRIIWWTGCAGITATLTAPFLLRRFSWSSLALITPVLGLALGLLFFASPFPLLFGALHSCLVRASRQAIADPLVQTAYLTLDNEQKIAGKAFVCSLSPTIGKVAVALLFLSAAWTIGALALAALLSIWAIYRASATISRTQSS